MSKNFPWGIDCSYYACTQTLRTSYVSMHSVYEDTCTYVHSITTRKEGAWLKNTHEESYVNNSRYIQGSSMGVPQSTGALATIINFLYSIINFLYSTTLRCIQVGKWLIHTWSTLPTNSSWERLKVATVRLCSLARQSSWSGWQEGTNQLRWGSLHTCICIHACTVCRRERERREMYMYIHVHVHDTGWQ